MKIASKLALLAIVTAMVFSSCRRDDCDDPIPSITFNNFIQYQDSATLIIDFVDCDGDIGLSENQTEPPFDFNLFVDYYELQNGEWTLIGNLEPKLYYRIPVIDAEGNSKKLDGEIEVKMYNYYNPFSEFDTIRYDIKLKDRALNESNLISTPVFLAP